MDKLALAIEYIEQSAAVSDYDKIAKAAMLLRQYQEESARHMDHMRTLISFIRDEAGKGRDWAHGHFCVSRSQCQSIYDRAVFALKKL